MNKFQKRFQCKSLIKSIYLHKLYTINHRGLIDTPLILFGSVLLERLPMSGLLFQLGHVAPKFPLEQKLPVDRLQVVHAARLQVADRFGDELVGDLDLGAGKPQLPGIPTGQFEAVQEQMIAHSGPQHPFALHCSDLRYVFVRYSPGESSEFLSP